MEVVMSIMGAPVQSEVVRSRSLHKAAPASCLYSPDTKARVERIKASYLPGGGV